MRDDIDFGRLGLTRSRPCCCGCSGICCVSYDRYVIKSTLYPEVPYFAGMHGSYSHVAPTWSAYQLAAKSWGSRYQADRAFDRLPADLRNVSHVVRIRTRPRCCRKGRR